MRYLLIAAMLMFCGCATLQEDINAVKERVAVYEDKAIKINELLLRIKDEKDPEAAKLLIDELEELMNGD